MGRSPPIVGSLVLVFERSKIARRQIRCAIGTPKSRFFNHQQHSQQHKVTSVETSNYLPELAARIRAEHQATADALKTSVQHAIAAGELLIEAKALLKHGQWLPWLQDHCVMSERTAQLYMRCAKNREAIEQNTQPVADLTLNEAAALLMLPTCVSCWRWPRPCRTCRATHWSSSALPTISGC
jgi:hypothetical protein